MYSTHDCVLQVEVTTESFSMFLAYDVPGCYCQLLKACASILNTCLQKIYNEHKCMHWTHTDIKCKTKENDNMNNYDNFISFLFNFEAECSTTPAV